MDTLVKKVNSGQRLAFDEAVSLFEGMVQDRMSDSQIASALIAMKFRHETVDEVSALVATLDRHKRKFTSGSDDAVDTCGTGGDGKSTVNISTAVSIILSSMGCSVVKHGNTAQSGIVGSADILRELGMDLNYSDSSPEEYYKKHGYIFLMAPHYHPALKRVGAVRRELKVPTIFNFVGPLINPADPAYQVIGISRRDRLDFIAQVIRKIGKRNITAVFFTRRLRRSVIPGHNRMHLYQRRQRPPVHHRSVRLLRALFHARRQRSERSEKAVSGGPLGRKRADL